MSDKKNYLDLGSRRRKTGLFLTSIAVLLILSLAFYSPNSSYDLGKSEVVSDYENSIQDIHDLYNSSHFGKNYRRGVDARIDEDFLLPIPLYPETLFIFNYQPPNLVNIDDAVQHILNYSYDVDVWDITADTSSGITVYAFSNDSTVIGLTARNGYVAVQNDVSSIPEKEEPISKDIALNMAQEYLSNHNMLPKNDFVMSISASTTVVLATNESYNDTYFVQYRQVINDIPVTQGYYENHIIVVVDALRGAISYIGYHWPCFELLGNLDDDIVSPLIEKIDEFIEDHNEHINSSSMVNLTDVKLIYTPVPDHSVFDSTMSPYYFTYIPMIVVTWETGLTYLSPIKDNT